MTRFPDKRIGDRFTTRDYNAIARAVRRLLNIRGAIGSNITVSNTSAGIVIKGERRPLFYVKCTAKNTPSAGLHTFKKCDWQGILFTGDAARTFTKCKLIGDFSKDWDIAAADANGITGLDSATKTITVSGDHASEYSADDKVTISGSTDNDGTYTVVSSTYNDPNTDIVVEEAIDDTTVDGTISNAKDATFGMIVIKKTRDGYSNQVLLLPYPGNAYYFE